MTSLPDTFHIPPRARRSSVTAPRPGGLGISPTASSGSSASYSNPPSATMSSSVTFPSSAGSHGSLAGPGSSPRVRATSSASASPHAHPTHPHVHPSIPSPRAVPLPVPQRHGSINRGSMGSVTDFAALSPGGRSVRDSISMRDSISGMMGSGMGMAGSGGGSFGNYSIPPRRDSSLSLSNSLVLPPSSMSDSMGFGTLGGLGLPSIGITDDPADWEWLDLSAGEIARKEMDETTIVAGDTSLEQATEILIKSEQSALIVQTGSGYGLFDFADLNTVLLLVLASASQASFNPLDERACEIVSCLKRGVRLGIGMVCDISGKNPCKSYPPDTPLRSLLPLLASGIHRVVLTSEPPVILSAAMLLEYLTTKPPPLFSYPISEVDLPLHALVSLPVSASVLDAMQILSLNGLGALGVVTGGDTERDPELSSLVGVVTTADCARLVVPSEGKQALGMGLGDMCKNILVDYHGRERGEERVPVHTITPGTTLLHAANLILATSSSRVFMRTTISAASPPLSPASSFEGPSPSPPLSTSTSSLSLAGLPAPPSIQLSPQYVISITDILSALARRCSYKLTPLPLDMESEESWDMLPDTMAKRRRRASSSFVGFETWRWAPATQQSPF